MGILANPVAVWIAFIIGAILFVITLYLLFNEDADATSRVGAIITGLLCVVVGLAWFYGTTHRVVPINERWVIVNTANGTIEGQTRSSGITTKPFLMYSIKRYPGVAQQPFCLDYTPALKEGYEITTHVCGTYDASTINWSQMYTRYNFNSEEAMIKYWSNQSKELVSAALLNADYTTIVTNRSEVSKAIRDSLAPWFSEFGVSVSNLQLTNWDFTSPDVRAQVDAASAASMKKTVESQLLEAAKIARERQLYEVQTANLVLAERGNGLEALFAALNITDDNAKAWLASQMSWLAYAQNPPDGVNVFIGADAIAVPAGNQPAPANVPSTTP